jgi:hypothetical protein
MSLRRSLLIACFAVFLASQATAATLRKPPMMLAQTRTIAAATGFGRLEDTPLAPGDIELRVWEMGAFSPGHLLRLRRAADGSTTGSFHRFFSKEMKQFGDSGPFAGELEEDCVDLRDAGDDLVCTATFTRRPQWKKIFSRLDALGIRTLPDASELPPPEIELTDGWVLLVEVREGDAYRAYEYFNPGFIPGPEAAAARDVAEEVFKLMRREGR